MANYNFISSSPVKQLNSSILFKSTTQSLTVNPTFESIDNVYDTQIPRELGQIIGLVSQPFKFDTPRRPSSGQLYPRGNQ